MFQIFLIGFNVMASASEVKGVKAPSISINDLFLQPRLRIVEKSSGGFQAIDANVSMLTKIDAWFDAQVVLGSSSSLNQPAWVAPTSESLTVLKAIGTYHSPFGDIYAGQFQVPWGLEGTISDKDLWFPRSLFYLNGVFPLYDLGAGYFIDWDKFNFYFAVHNGEGALNPDRDNRLFVTGQWRYNGPANMKAGISATAGRVSAPNVLTERRLRGANAFFGFHIFGLGLQLEGSFLQDLSQTLDKDVVAWHAALEHPVTDNINALLRYEELNPNSRVESDVLGRAFIGAEIHNKSSTSRLFVFLVKNTESQNEIKNDEIQVMWRLTPEI